jgi:HEAT repeat protein
VTLAEIFQYAEGTLDGDAYLAIRNVAASGDRAAIASVRAALERHTADRNWYGRDLMAHLLARLAGSEAFPLLLDLYADAMRRDDGDDWESLGRALGAIMQADPVGCRAVILPLVNEDDQHVRRAALWAIGYVFEPSDLAMLREALADSDSWIRFTALGSLPTVKDNAEIYHLLVATLRDPDRWVQRTAVLLLAWSAPPKVVDHLIPLISAPDFHARSALGEAIGRMAANSEHAPAAAAALRQLLVDPEPSVRTGAVRGLGLLGGPLDILGSMSGDPDWRVRSAVADVYRST